MGNLDAFFQYVIFSLCIPTVIVVLLIRWYFDLNLKKIETWIEDKFMKWVHKKLEKEKKMLFGQMNRIRFGDNLNRNQRGTVLNVLEIGVGSGRNFNFYPEKAVVTCLDPNPHQEIYIRENLKEAQRKLRLKQIVKGFAEDMKDIDSNQFDVVVCTMTLCTVRNPEAVLEEVRRVLKPGGKFYFLEHVAGSKNSFIRRVQNRLNRPWAYMSKGCCINRETWTYFERSNFSQVSIQHFKMGFLFLFVRVWIHGVASKW